MGGRFERFKERKKGRGGLRMRQRDYAVMNTWYILMLCVETDHNRRQAKVFKGTTINRQSSMSLEPPVHGVP